MEQHIDIHLVLKLVSPLSSIAPGSTKINPDTGYFADSGDGMFPIARTFCIPVIARDEETGKRLREIPILRANTPRSAIRRAARDVIAEEFRTRGLKVDAQTYQVLSRGSHTTQPEASQNLAVNRRAIEHMFLGLVGGSELMIPSAYSLGDFLPIIDYTVSSKFLPESIFGRFVTPIPDFSPVGSRIAGTGGLTYALWFRATDALLSFADPKAAEFIADYQASVEDWARVLSVAKAKKDDEKKAEKKPSPDEKGKKVDLRSLNCVEAVTPGINMGTSISFRTRGLPKEVWLPQLGLLIESLRRALMTPMGANVRHGFGKFLVLQADMSVREGIGHTAESKGATFEIDPGTSELSMNLGNDLVREAADAYSAALSGLTPENLRESLFNPPAK